MTSSSIPKKWHLNTRPVYFDVYSWVKETEKQPWVPHAVMQGPFRWAQHFSKLYWPAIIIAPSEMTQLNAEAIQKVEVALGKQVRIFRNYEFERVVKVWISLGVDHTSPMLPRMVTGSRKLMAILHDTMSYEGEFGPDAVNRFVRGADNTNVFLYVSETSRNRFIENDPDATKNRVMIPLYNTHGFLDSMTLPFHDANPDLKKSLSVGSVFPRKNFILSADIANHYMLYHTHVGAFLEGDKDYWQMLRDTRMFEHYEVVNDSDLVSMYQGAGTFFQLSRDEGFSMTPMEAMLCGTERIVLSDIPVHREIYGKYNVNFVDLKSPYLSLPEELKRVRDTDRFHIFERFKFDTVIQPLVEYIDAFV